ncbi:hypothetical protein [Sphingobacterium daejeonense]|uniref:hypothetical protein n=1 Tax=Sphingobacterium daejeonense TaxID=371142 RepID=UPI0010C2580A|nr:hypothetical protein [Sphingobacterium daejeonense]VTP97378.1 Uncharacterised protein [Sphingobacterium daejeonense]
MYLSVPDLSVLIGLNIFFRTGLTPQNFNVAIFNDFTDGAPFINRSIITGVSIVVMICAVLELNNFWNASA